MEKYNEELKRKNRNKLIFRLVLMSIILILLFFFLIYPIFNIKQKKHNIDSDKIADTFKDYTLFQVSDLYLKPDSDLEKLRSTISSKNPQVLIFSGNTFTVEDEKLYENFIKFKQGIDENILVYITKGETELKMDEAYQQELFDKLKSEDVYLLDNRSASVNKGGKTINLFGFTPSLEDYKVANDKLTHTSNIELPTDKFNIVISHNPSYAQMLSEQGADLILSGARNGGWIRIPFIGGLDYDVESKYKDGNYQLNNAKLIVSKGTGSKDGKFRLMNQREIIELKLGVSNGK